MNKKKHVIFYFNNQKQFYGEFHENSKLRLIKAYLRDISHIGEFNTIFNGETLINEELSLKEIINNKSSKSDIIFKIDEVKMLAIEEIKHINSTKLSEYQQKNNDLIFQVNMYKTENGNILFKFFL